VSLIKIFSFSFKAFNFNFSNSNKYKFSWSTTDWCSIRQWYSQSCTKYFCTSTRNSICSRYRSKNKRQKTKAFDCISSFF